MNRLVIWAALTLAAVVLPVQAGDRSFEAGRKEPPEQRSSAMASSRQLARQDLGRVRVTAAGGNVPAVVLGERAAGNAAEAMPQCEQRHLEQALSRPGHRHGAGSRRQRRQRQLALVLP